MRFGPSVPAKLMIAAADGGPARQVGPDLDANGNFLFEFSPDGRKVLVADRKGATSQVTDVADGRAEQRDRRRLGDLAAAGRTGRLISRSDRSPDRCS